MSIDTLRDFLLYSTLINFVILLWWFGWLVFAHDSVYRLHRRWFALSVEQFDAIHYAAMAGYKLAVMVFFFVPWLALTILA